MKPAKRPERSTIYFHTAPVLEIGKQIQQLLEGTKNAEDADSGGDWNPPIPEYIFPERARLVGGGPPVLNSTFIKKWIFRSIGKLDWSQQVEKQ